MYDVIVVGAGPSGLYSASLLEKSLRVLVLEEHKEIGKPVQCSGLISKNLGGFVRIDEGFVENEVRGAILHSPKNEVKLEKPDGAAYVIDRGKFDRFLERGLKSEIVLNSKVSKVDVKRDFVSVKTQGKEFKSRMLLGCDGPDSFVRNHFGIRPRESLRGLIAITKEKSDSDFVELWFDKSLLPDGFFWKIPRGESMEYGMLSKNAKFQGLENFFSLKGYEKRAGLIPIGLQKTYFPRTLLVGDAAGQVKPWSGGGVIYGLTCAKIASDTIKKAFKERDFSEEFLKQYETLWRKNIGKNIILGLMFREFYKDMDSGDLERFFEKLKGRRLDELDMDFPIGILE
jgi:digeranylgeranylglycerophospholipid reductase